MKGCASAWVSWHARHALGPRASFFVVLLALACNTSSTTTDTKPGAEAKGGESKAAIDPAIAKKLADGTKALRSIPAAQRSELAAVALAEAEVGRLPPELVTAFGEMSTVPPEMRGLIAMKALASPDMLTPLQALCDGKGTDTLSKVAQVAPGEKIALVWEGCGLDKAALVTRAQADQAALGPLMLAHVAHRVLTDAGGATDDELTLLRAFVVGSGARG